MLNVLQNWQYLHFLSIRTKMHNDVHFFFRNSEINKELEPAWQPCFDRSIKRISQ